MTVSTLTHLNFRGEARAALEFYAAVFGGQAMIGTYGEGGVPQDSAGPGEAVFAPLEPGSSDADRVSFGMVMAPNGFRIAAYDVFGASPGDRPDRTGRAQRLTHDESFFVVLNGDTVEEITALWDGLVEGGTVIQQLAPAPWGPAYGMLTDRFGVTWILGVQ